MAVEGVSWESLMLLIKASSKEQVLKICEEAFKVANSDIPDEVVKNVTNSLTVEAKEAVQVIHSLSKLITAVLFQSLTEPQQLQAIFPSGFHKNLKELLSKIIAEKLPQWRSCLIKNQVSLPKLVDFEWQINIKTSSEMVSRMSVPTCMLQLQMQGNPIETNEIQSVEHVTVELSKQTIDTMLDGLVKIRDQLSSISTK